MDSCFEALCIHIEIDRNISCLHCFSDRRSYFTECGAFGQFFQLAAGVSFRNSIDKILQRISVGLLNIRDSRSCNRDAAVPYVLDRSHKCFYRLIGIGIHHQKMVEYFFRTAVNRLNAVVEKIVHEAHCSFQLIYLLIGKIPYCIRDGLSDDSSNIPPTVYKALIRAGINKTAVLSDYTAYIIACGFIANLSGISAALDDTVVFPRDAGNIAEIHKIILREIGNIKIGKRKSGKVQ